jgi:hypothetical protein
LFSSDVSAGDVTDSIFSLVKYEFVGFTGEYFTTMIIAVDSILNREKKRGKNFIKISPRTTPWDYARERTG